MKASNKLLVDETINDNNEMVSVHTKTMGKLGFSCGETILIKCKKRDTLCIVVSDDTCEESRIRMSEVVRWNLSVRLGDMVSVHQCGEDLKHGKRIHVLPFDDTIKDLNGNLFDAYLKPWFSERCRPVETFCQGEHVRREDKKGLDNLGGVRRQLALMRERVELRFPRSRVFKNRR